MLLSAKAADQIVRHARTERGNYSDRKIKGGNPRVDPFDQQNASKGDRVKDPLQAADAFTEQKDRDHAGEDRRKILDRHRRSKRDVLERGKKQEQRSSTEKPPK